MKYSTNNNWNVSGTELNEQLVLVANKSGYDVEHTDNLSGFSDDTFDLVVAFDVLEHIPEDRIFDFIFEVRRVMKKNGIFIARFPNGDSPFGLKNQNGDSTHVTTIGSGKIEYFAAKTAMEVVFIGVEASPLFGVSMLHFIHRLIASPIKLILNIIINLIFFPAVMFHFVIQT